MNSIYKIYEGLLSKTKTKLDKVKTDIQIDVMNEPDSELRKFFIEPNWVKTPYSTDGKTFVYKPNKNFQLLQSPDKSLVNIIGDNFDCFRINGGCVFRNVNVGKDVHTNIEIESVRFEEDCVLDGVTVKTIPATKYNLYPNIIIEHSTTVKNCTFEIDTSRVGEDYGALRFEGCVPTFINNKSETIKKVRVESGWKTSIFDSPGWDKLFEFGYRLGYRQVSSGNFKYMNIKSIDELIKILKSKQFTTREYDQFPYRINPNFKLSDILDVTKFKSLKTVSFWERTKIEIVFENINRCSESDSILALFPTYTLLQGNAASKRDVKQMLRDVPVTSDGWRVIVNTGM